MGVAFGEGAGEGVHLGVAFGEGVPYRSEIFRRLHPHRNGPAEGRRRLVKSRSNLIQRFRISHAYLRTAPSVKQVEALLNPMRELRISQKTGIIRPMVTESGGKELFNFYVRTDRIPFRP